MIALFGLLAIPPEAAAKLCRGENEVACKRRPECQWLARERRAPEDQARAEASPEYHCVPRPATGDSILDRQERASRRARDARGGAALPEHREREMKRFEQRDRIEQDAPRRDRTEPRAHRKERVERDIPRPDRLERDTKPRQRSGRAMRERERNASRERARSPRPGQAHREEREVGRQKATRKPPATQDEQRRPERARGDD